MIEAGKAKRAGLLATQFDPRWRKSHGLERIKQNRRHLLGTELIGIGFSTVLLSMSRWSDLMMATRSDTIARWISLLPTINADLNLCRQTSLQLSDCLRMPDLAFMGAHESWTV